MNKSQKLEILHNEIIFKAKEIKRLKKEIKIFGEFLKYLDKVKIKDGLIYFNY